MMLVCSNGLLDPARMLIGTGSITLPNSKIPISYPIFPNSAEKRAARQHIEYLDQRARNGQSEEVRQALGSVQSLLDPMNISEL